MRKQTTITIETRSLLVLRTRRFSRVWCPVCRTDTDFIVIEPGGLSGQEATVFEQWFTSEDVHRAEAPDRSFLICLKSLLHRVPTTKRVDCGLPQLPKSKKEKT
jgi:hypothetical protein